MEKPVAQQRQCVVIGGLADDADDGWLGEGGSHFNCRLATATKWRFGQKFFDG